MNSDRCSCKQSRADVRSDVLVQNCTRLGERCESVTHTSGLQILLVPKQMAVTYATLVVAFGARDVSFELNGKMRRLPDGVAHFLEHKMFACPDGTDANEHFSALGADANAWTDHDQTAYLFSTSEAPAPALRVLLDMVLHPHFTKENVARERRIIREEICMGEDDPWQRLHEQTMRAMYARHALRRRICGTSSSIARISPGTLLDCHRAFYRPRNMCLIVCGSIAMEDIIREVDAVMEENSATPLTNAVKRCEEAEPTAVVHRRACRRARVAQPLFQIAVKDTCLPKDGKARLRRETAMNLISEILFSRAAPFYGDLFENGQITPGYSYGYSTVRGAAYHAVTGEARDADAVWSKYCEVIEAAQREGLCADDFERCRRVLYASFVSQFDYPEDIADLMCEAQSNGVGVFDTLDVLDSITLGELEALLLEVFVPEATVFSTLLPDKNKNEKE